MAVTAFQIEHWPVEKLIPYANNPRTHTPEQIQQIAASIKEFGFTNPILADEKGIIAGHGRLMAAQALQLPTVPVIPLRHLTDAQRQAYVIADNKLALNAGWDADLLAKELKELEEAGFPLDMTGFGQEELDDLFASITDTSIEGDEDDAPAPQEKAVSAPGDVWLLGKHRVMCGDSTSADDVEKLVDEAKGCVWPHLMVTDPPYGVEYDATKARPVSAGSAKGKVVNDDRADWREAWALFPGDVAYVWHGMLHSKVVAESLEACGFVIRDEIVWAKSQLVMSRGHYHAQHESCWYAVRDDGTAHWQGSRTQSTLWDIDKPQKNDTGHSTQKPVECMRRPIENNSKAGNAVYDPFLGSGTTLIAAQTTGRICYGMEISPAYVDVTIRRWQKATGEQAVRESDGMAFADVEKAGA